MREYTLEMLAGNLFFEEFEILDAHRDDARQSPRPSGALIDSVEAEMAAAFGWDTPPTDEEMDADYAARECDADALLARYPGLLDKPSDFLIELIADPTGFGDDDEVTAVAAILLERRMKADASLVPLLTASIAYEKAMRKA